MDGLNLTYFHINIPLSINRKDDDNAMNKISELNSFEKSSPIDSASRVLIQESEAIKNLLLNNNLKPKIILVTSAMHMNRAIFLFRRQGIDVIPYPVDFKSSRITNLELFFNLMHWIPSPSNLHLSSISLREILGRIYYFLDIYKIVKSF